MATTPAREPAERLVNALRGAGGTAETKLVPNVGHDFVDEPGDVAAPQGPSARAVDQLASEWFGRHLARADSR